MKNKLLLFIIFAVLSCAAFGQNTPGTLNYPSSLDTPDSLFRTSDRAKSYLASTVTASATTIPLASAATFPVSGAIVIGSETIYYTGKSGNSLTGAMRGASGTIATTHTIGREVRGAIIAQHHDIQSQAIIALQNKIGTGSNSAAANTILAGTGTAQSAWTSAPTLSRLNFVGGNFIFSGSGSPESAVIAPVGSLYLRQDGASGTIVYVKNSGTSSTGWAVLGGGGGSGTVGSVAVTAANGISGTVSNATTTPAITLSLGAITPTSISATGTVTGSNLSGTNTGDQNLGGLLVKSSNLSDLTNPSAARTNLGFGNVDNTSDASKPISTAQQTALNLKANSVSPSFTGTPSAPTAAVGTNTTQIATTAFVLANAGSGAIPDGDKGDIIVSNSGATFTVDAGTITTAKLGGDITAAGKALLDDASATAQRTTLGLGTLATQSGTFSGTSSGTNTGDQDLSAYSTTTAVSTAINNERSATKIFTNTTLDGAGVGNSVINATANKITTASEFQPGTCENGKILSINNFGNFICEDGAWSQIIVAKTEGTAANQFFRRSADNTKYEPVDLIGVGITVSHGTTNGVPSTTLTATGGGGGSATGAPVASNVVITGTTEVGSTLTGTFTRTDAEGDAAGTPVNQWYRSDNTAGLNKTPISGATASTYLLTSADLNKRIEWSVIPTSLTGATTGAQVFSSYTNAITAPGGGAGGGGAGETNATGYINTGGTISGGNNLTQSNAASVMNGGVEERLSSGAGVERYWKFGLIGTNWDGMRVNFQDNVNFENIMSLNFTATTMTPSLTVGGLQDPITIDNDDRISVGFDGANHVRIWVNDVVVYTSTQVIATQDVFLNLRTGNEDANVRGYSNIVYK